MFLKLSLMTLLLVCLLTLPGIKTLSSCSETGYPHGCAAAYARANSLTTCYFITKYGKTHPEALQHPFVGRATVQRILLALQRDC